MTVLVTGDLHGALDIHRLFPSELPGGASLTKGDYLVVCGDFGLVWNFGVEELGWLDWLDARPWTTLFVDGNHENHDALDAMACERWHGGLVHRVRPSVLHLMRGEVFDLGGASVLAMGGATSVDRALRTPGESWWARELPSAEEYARAERNLDARGWRVDYVVTHCCATRLLEAVYDGDVWQGADALTEWFELLEHRLVFRHWYFGHHHRDRAIPPDHRAVYRDVVPLGSDEPWEGSRPARSEEFVAAAPQAPCPGGPDARARDNGGRWSA